jgi:hypothetical protein
MLPSNGLLPRPKPDMPRMRTLWVVSSSAALDLILLITGLGLGIVQSGHRTRVLIFLGEFTVEQRQAPLHDVERLLSIDSKLGVI